MKPEFAILQGSAVNILAHARQSLKVDHIISDPPYSNKVHTKARGNAGAAGIVERDFGYSYLTREERSALVRFAASNVERWTILFSDVETAYLWRLFGIAAGLDYVRTRAWQRWSAPQFTGDRPSTDHESVIFMHHKGRKEWNCGGGGKETFLTDRLDVETLFDRVARGEISPQQATDQFFLVEKCLRAKEKNREGHPNEKPLELMRQIVGFVAKPGETILDPFSGSGTTGVAALEAGCNYIGIEENPEWVEKSRERLSKV